MRFPFTAAFAMPLLVFAAGPSLADAGCTTAERCVNGACVPFVTPRPGDPIWGAPEGMTNPLGEALNSVLSVSCPDVNLPARTGKICLAYVGPPAVGTRAKYSSNGKDCDIELFGHPKVCGSGYQPGMCGLDIK